MLNLAGGVSPFLSGAVAAIVERSWCFCCGAVCVKLGLPNFTVELRGLLRLLMGLLSVFVGTFRCLWGAVNVNVMAGGAGLIAGCFP